jgi:hypothetical protein
MNRRPDQEKKSKNPRLKVREGLDIDELSFHFMGWQSAGQFEACPPDG